jgi:hypothetical protein
MQTGASMREFVFSLAHEARRTGLVATIHRQREKLTLARLDVLLGDGKYGDDLAKITVAELLEPQPRAPAIRFGETLEDAILRVFRAQPNTWLTSGFFTRYLQVPRWTSQATLASLAEQGLLIRRGKTSSTRYCLARGQARADDDSS